MENKKMLCHGQCKHCDVIGCKLRLEGNHPILDETLDRVLDDILDGSYTSNRKAKGTY